MNKVVPDTKSKSFSFKSPEIRIWLIRIGAACILVVIGTFFLNYITLPNQVAKIFEIKASSQQLDLMITELRTRIEQQEELIRQIPHSNFFENEARAQGMIQKGEKIYQVEIEPEPNPRGN